MADVERLIVAKVIRDEDMAALIEAKIGDDFFVDEEHLAALRWMRRHWTRYGKSPGEQAFKAEFPTYKLPPTPEPMAFYIDSLKRAYRYDILGTAVQDASDVLADEGDPDEAEKVLAAAITQVASATSSMRDHNLTDAEDFSRLYDFYDSLTQNPGALRGISSGFPTIDLATMGFQPGQLVTFVGPPKAGKSTVLLCCADAAEKAGVDSLLISFEMSYEEMVARWVGLRASTNYRRLLKGKMNDKDRKRLDRLEKQLTNRDHAKLILSEDVTSTTTVGGVVAKLQQHRPKIVFIDGVYLMDDENGEPKGSAQAITNITRSLKRVGQTFGVPVVITTQALFSKMRGSSVKASSIGYSSSFGQDSDTVIAVEPREDADTGEQEHWLKVLLSRSGPQVEVEIDFDWTTSTFTEFGSTGDVADPDEYDPEAA